MFIHTRGKSKLKATLQFLSWGQPEMKIITALFSLTANYLRAIFTAFTLDVFGERDVRWELVSWSVV